MNNNNHNRNDSLREIILSRIQKENIAMKPRLYFTLQVAAVAIVAALSLLLSIFIFNFILFSIRINGHDAFLSFGSRGVQGFLTYFPWLTLLLDGALILLLEWLVRKFRFGYRIPIMVLVLGIISLTVIAGLTLDRGTYFNDRLMDRAEHEGLPAPLYGLYHGARRAPHDGICRCTITAINGAELTVADFRDGATTTFTVLVPGDNPYATSTDLKVGDVVFVAGDNDGDEDEVIRAFGVRKENDRGYRGRPPKPSPDHY